jgi:hypothetical protein
MAWQQRFKAEIAANNQRDPKWKAHQLMLSKPSGKKIFENAKGMEEFFDDNKNEDDDEVLSFFLREIGCRYIGNGKG